MKIVIDMDDEIYNEIKNKGQGKWYCREMDNAIRQGTPLPKGCERIVDIDKLIDSKCNECGHVRGVSCTVPCYEVRRMLSAPTVIEADKEDK